MADKKSTSRIIDEMNETIRGLDCCEQKNVSQLEKLKKNTKGKTQEAKSVDEIRTDKCQASK